ncbi:hypothetical protein D1AOALGA4SA_1351 [Olavius algarvensis Delta 1 endosymbiont]|nr:hypothetical protein D1AOALGA4SA_1351 [Olavius algarvensis Delta 1 endosymbiont]
MGFRVQGSKVQGSRFRVCDFTCGFNPTRGIQCAPGLQCGPSDRYRNFWGSAPKSTLVGFQILQKCQQNVGWVECNETQQHLE